MAQEHKRTCDVCGATFTASDSRRRRCSTECGYEAERRKARERARQNSGYYARDRRRQCDVCGSVFEWKVPNQQRCSKECSSLANKAQEARYRSENCEKRSEYCRKYRAKNRDRLNESMRRWHADNREHERKYARQRYRSNPEVREKLAEYKRRNADKYVAYQSVRRAREKAQNVEAVDLRTLVRRKGFFCGICGRIAFPQIENRYHPLRMQIDHIIPLSAGGENSYANCQPAHQSCNMQKKDRVDGWQGITPNLDGWDDNYTKVYHAQQLAG